MITIADAEDSFMMANAALEEWKQEFEMGWWAPMGATMLALVMASMTPEQLAAMQQAGGEQINALMRIITSGGTHVA